MFTLTPAFIQPTRSVFDDLDLVANFREPCFYLPGYAEEIEKLHGNQLDLTLPANISGDRIKATINKKTGIFTVSVENSSEREFSRNGWNGKSQSFSSFSRSVRLPKHVVGNEELMRQVTADVKENKLRITFPEQKTTGQKTEREIENNDLINIETVKE